VACPYFFPTEKTFAIGWPFPHRLPLGGGFCGTCRAGKQEFLPDETALRDFCNLGHARGCDRMPVQRPADSIRFAVARDCGGRILLHYVYDREHTPVAHGELEYDCVAERWLLTLEDTCGQRQAECYLLTYLDRRPR
jgi:hypothetical protein